MYIYETRFEILCLSAHVCELYTAYCIWNVTQSFANLSLIGLFQRNVAKET